MAEVEKQLTDDQIKGLQQKTDANVEKKYDRQIRLWGMLGQQALSKTHICLLGAGPTGTETLKNLILPGIGKFSVIDGEVVSQRDLGNNFFVEYSGLGKSRAEETARLLHELNCWCERGNTIQADPAALIAKDPDFVRDYDVLIANNLSDSACQKLGEACQKWGKTVLICHTNGMAGVIRSYAPEHKILETKRENSKWDFRIQHPWPEWQAYADSFDVEALRPDTPEFTHIPFLVLLMDALKRWKVAHGDAPITKDEQKDAFKALIVKIGQEHSMAGNFQEARDNAHNAYVPYEIPSDTQMCLDDPRTENLTPETPRFWVLVTALKAFVAASGGYLPLNASLPDITTKASTYVAIQKLFRAKALADVETFKGFLYSILKTLGKPESDFPDDYVSAFCRHAGTLRVLNYNPITNDYDTKKMNVSDLGANLWGDTAPRAYWYLAFRAAGRFQEQNGRLPGDRNDDGQADFDALKKCADQLIAELEFEPDTIPVNYLKEICRFGGSQIHSICSYMGGVAAQEIIKFVTHQWEPFVNTFVYDGITGSSGSFEI